MKKGISIWSFAEKDLKKCFELAKDAGYDGVEVALDEKGLISLESTKEDAIAVRAMAEEAGIELYSLASLLYWTYNYTSENEENRKKAKEITKKQLQVASWLGCDSILVVPGAVGVDWLPGTEVVDYEVAYNRAYEALKEMAPIAEEYKVHIAIENVGNKFLLSPLEMRRLIDSIDSQYVGAYFDVGNVLSTGYPEHWIRILGDRIKKIHLKDYKRAKYAMVDLLAGDVDYIAVKAMLETIGYNDWLTAEMIPPYAQFPETILYNTSNSMDKIMGRK